MSRYGTLIDAGTGATVRPATASEAARSQINREAGFGPEFYERGAKNYYYVSGFDPFDERTLTEYKQAEEARRNGTCSTC